MRHLPRHHPRQRPNALQASGLAVLLAVAGCGSGVLATPGATAISTTGPASVFSVTLYGATGNGRSDDAPAIAATLHAAIAAAGTAGSATVAFPCGEFDLESLQGNAPGGRSLLYVQGASHLQITGVGSCSHLFTTQPLKTVLEVANSTQIAISQLRITAVNAPMGVERYGMDGGAAIRLSQVTGGSIAHVEIDGAAIGALYLTQGTAHIAVTDNNIHDTYGGGIWEDDCSGLSATTCAPSTPPAWNTYQDNVLTNTSQALTTAITLDDGGNSSYAVVEGNTVSWNKPTLPGNNEVFCVEISHASDVSVLNNRCSHAPYAGIVVLGAGGTPIVRDIIQGNTIDTAGTSGQGGVGIELYDQTTGSGISDFIIAGNSIAYTGSDGILLVSATTPGSIHNGQITGNRIDMADQQTPGSSFGIDLRASDAITASTNTITCNGQCIAAGLRLLHATNSTPAAAANTVTDILGPALLAQ